MAKIFAYRALGIGSAVVSNAVKAISHTDFGLAAADIAKAQSCAIGTMVTDGAGTYIGSVNFTYDGTDPTVSLGIHLPAGSTIELLRQENIANLKFIRSDADDAIVTIVLEW